MIVVVIGFPVIVAVVVAVVLVIIIVDVSACAADVNLVVDWLLLLWFLMLSLLTLEVTLL